MLKRENRLSLMLSKWSLSDTTHDNIPDKGSATDFLDATGKKFKVPDKAEIENLMSFLWTLNIKMWVEYDILVRKVQAFVRLKELEVAIADEYIADQVLNRLPTSFNQL